MTMLRLFTASVASLVLALAAQADGMKVAAPAKPTGAPTKPVAVPEQHLKIDAGGSGTQSRRVTMSAGKGMIVELPQDARDVLVSNPDIVDAIVRTPRQIYLVGRKTGPTNAFFFAANGKQILNLEIRVERDMTELKNIIERNVQGSTVDVETINDSVVLNGSVKSASDAEAARQIAMRYITEAGKEPVDTSVVNRVGIRSGEQVMLSVRVAEMQRTLSKQIGTNVYGSFDLGNGAPGSITNVNPFSLLGSALAPGSNIVLGEFDALGNAISPAAAVIRAFERSGMIKTLAEPNLTAISGESAKFLAGGEYPVPVGRDQDGNITLEFKPYGVGLGFTPVVLSDGRISLRISTEVSELSAEDALILGDVAIPALRVRRAETTVELPSGGSMVMAGMLKQDMKQNIDGLPGLRNIPILGALFQSRDFQSGETELVVIVTPYLVKPAARTALSTPADGFVPPTDAETVFLSRLNAVYGKGEKVDGKLKGPAGFTIQ
ncbi:MAG: type II and III secretion system protein family protein [Alphaproteobacteria bacterium]|nr:type II and III secretion system protein family protein [Alphaproteobacteria bacterium]